MAERLSFLDSFSKRFEKLNNHYIYLFNIHGKIDDMQEVSERASPLATE